MTDTIGMLLITVGVLFDLFGCIGLIRLPDIYNRLQAATKCVTLGTCMILFGVAVITGIGSAGVKALLCAVFILLTSPVGAHALSRAAHRSGIRLWEGSVVDKYAEVDSENT
ncbi:MAG: Na+/H+ antiporter subunit G [Candidatus Latescibacteria bacterium]|nr:Na+/H+ antiporter subunit G [Candidatus Latescibacterota bacterium]